MVNLNAINLTNTEKNYIKSQHNNPAGKLILKEMTRTCNVQYSEGKQRTVTIKSSRQNRTFLNNVNIQTMAPGRYTYMFEYNKETKQITYKFGHVTNPLEWCSRHYQLKSNDPNMYVLAAGELQYTGTEILFNFLTGTYMKIFTNYSIIGPIVTKLFKKLFPEKKINYRNRNLLYPGQPMNWTHLPKEINFESIKPAQYKLKYLKPLLKIIYGPIKDKLEYSKKEKYIHEMMKHHINKMMKSPATYENLFIYFNDPQKTFM